METLLLVLDLVGTLVFALSGATAGVNKRLDLFGVLVLSFTAGNAGGIARRETPAWTTIAALHARNDQFLGLECIYVSHDNESPEFLQPIVAPS
jgi:uncharacterized membrane protein YeiH